MEEVHSKLFTNCHVSWDTLYIIFRQVNKELLSAMEYSTDEIGKVFLELAPYLKFYSTYANDFEKATKLVEEWTDKHKVS